LMCIPSVLTLQLLKALKGKTSNTWVLNSSITKPETYSTPLYAFLPNDWRSIWDC
jgi:hypothetical protein